jgi:hypothetical protein
LKGRPPEHKVEWSQLDLTFAGGCKQIMFLLAINQSYDAQNWNELPSSYCTVVTNRKL